MCGSIRRQTIQSMVVAFRPLPLVHSSSSRSSSALGLLFRSQHRSLAAAAAPRPSHGAHHLKSGSKRQPLPPGTDLVLRPPCPSKHVASASRVGGEPQSQAALIFVPGVNLPAEAYRPMLSEVQRAAAARSVSLHVGCLGIDWSAAPLRKPEELGPRVEALLQRLRATRGASLGASAPVFHGAHSLSTCFLQDFLQRSGGTAGQILLGGCLMRKYCYPIFSYARPTLTIGAELDGVEGLLRQAEQFQIQSGLETHRFPLVVLPGQTHMQFASGERPKHMGPELPPMVKDQVAHGRIAEVASEFMCSQLGLSLLPRDGAGAGVDGVQEEAGGKNKSLLLDKVNDTGSMLLPVLLSHAMALEQRMLLDDVALRGR